MDNRIVALSVLEDLLFWPLPPCDGVVAAPDAFDDVDDLDEDELAMARLAAEENSLEPRAVREARYRAVLQLPLLCAKLGPRWTHAEVVPYLLRCLEEEDAPLSFAVGVALLGLVRPHTTTESERDRLAKDRAQAASASASSAPADDSTYAFLTLEEATPVVERLGACREERLRAFAAEVVVPHMCFGVPLDRGSALEGWDRKFLVPVHVMQSLEDQQAGAVGGDGDEDGTDETDGSSTQAAASMSAAAAAGSSSSASTSSSVRRAASAGAVDPRQRVLRQLREVLEQYRLRAIALSESTVSATQTPWTPLDYIYHQRLGVSVQASGSSAVSAASPAESGQGTHSKALLDEGTYQTLFALESVKLEQAADVRLRFLTPYLDRLSDAGVLNSAGYDEGNHGTSGSALIAKGGKEKMLLLRRAPLDTLGISYASDSFGNSDAVSDGSGDGTQSGSGSVRDHGVSTDPFTLNVRARALASDVVSWFHLITASPSAAPRHRILAADYLDAAEKAVPAALGVRWQTLQQLLQRLLGSSWPGAVAVGVEAITGLVYALTRALDFSRRAAAHNVAGELSQRASGAASVAVVAPPSIPLRLAHDAQLFHTLTTHLHLAFCVTAAVEAGLVASEVDSRAGGSEAEGSADNVWMRLNAALPVAINALYTQLYAHRVFLLVPVQLATAVPTWEWLVQLGPGPLEARVPMLATWDVAFATKTRTGQPDDIAVLLVRDDDEGESKTRAEPRVNDSALALSAEADAGWRRGVAGIASAFGMHHVLRLSLLRCLPMLASVEPCLGIRHVVGSGPAVAGSRSSRTRSDEAGAADQEVPAATLDVVVRLLAQVVAPPAALPHLLSELMQTTALLHGEPAAALPQQMRSCREEATSEAEPLSGASGSGSPRLGERSRSGASGLQRSRRASCFGMTSQLSMTLPPASPRGPRTQTEEDVPDALVRLLVSPVDALAFTAEQTPVVASSMGESPASTDYSLLEVVVSSIEKTLTRAALLLTTELSSFVDVIVSGRLEADSSVTVLATRTAAAVRLLFLLYQSCVRYIMVRASWKTRWLLTKRLPSLTAAFLYVLVSLSHVAASPAPIRCDRDNSEPVMDAIAAMGSLRRALQSIANTYFGFTCELLTAAWSGPHLGEPGVLFSLLSDDEAEVCYLSTHCLSGVFEGLTQAALRIAASTARYDAHIRHQKHTQHERQSASRPAEKAELEQSRREFAAALTPLFAHLRDFLDVVVDDCRLNLSDPLPRVRCGAVKGLASLSGVLSHVVAVTRYYEHYSEAAADAPLTQQPWADALTRTTQTLLSAMNDTSSVVQLVLVSELSHFLIRQGTKEQAAGQEEGEEAAQRVRYEALLRCLDGLSKHDVWRYRERYAALLAEMCFCFLTSASASLQKLAKEELLQLLVNTLFDKVKAVRDAALAATTKLCARLYAIAAAGSVSTDPVLANGFVNSTLWPIIYQTPRAWDTYLSRNALLQVALCLGVEKKGTMLPLLQKLAKDSVLNVRLVVAKTILQILIADRAANSGMDPAPHSAATRAAGDSHATAASAQPAGATTYELLMGKPPLFHMIRRIRPTVDGPRRPATSAAAAGATRSGSVSGSGAGSAVVSVESDGRREGAAGAGELALPLIAFSAEEKNGIVLTLLRQLLDDTSGDVRNEAAKALHVCF